MQNVVFMLTEGAAQDETEFGTDTNVLLTLYCTKHITKHAVFPENCITITWAESQHLH